MEQLKELAKEIRKDVLKMTYEKKAGFIGTSFPVQIFWLFCTEGLYGSILKIWIKRRMMSYF